MIQEKVELGMGSPAVRGRARVQVFDAVTGDCVRDEAHDNFVSPRFQQQRAEHPLRGDGVQDDPNHGDRADRL